MEHRRISSAVIRRLPRYYRFLADLQAENIERISSEELSRRMRVTASQIRQDLNNFGGFGQQGYGYNVGYLRDEIGKILGLDKKHNLIVIGAGNIGRALAGYSNFERQGFYVKGLFDIDPDVIGVSVRGIPVMHNDQICSFIRDNDIVIAVIAVSRESAQEIAELVYGCGIRAIWNFAHVDLVIPDDATVENVHLSESLLTLSYRLNAPQD